MDKATKTVNWVTAIVAIVAAVVWGLFTPYPLWLWVPVAVVFGIRIAVVQVLRNRR